MHENCAWLSRLESLMTMNRDVPVVFLRSGCDADTGRQQSGSYRQCLIRSPSIEMVRMNGTDVVIRDEMPPDDAVRAHAPWEKAIIVRLE